MRSDVLSRRLTAAGMDDELGWTIQPTQVMGEIQFPSGWDAERVRRLLAYYEGLADDEQVAEDESAAGEDNVDEK